MLSSLRARLLVGLLPPLTLLLAGGCGWLYWYQKEMMLRDFDRDLGRRAFEVTLHIRRAMERGTTEIDLPDTLVLAGSWDADTQQADWLFVEGIESPDGPLAPPPSEDKPAFHTVTLPDGRDIRVMSMWTPRPWRGRPRRRDRSDRRDSESNRRPATTEGTETENDGEPQGQPPADRQSREDQQYDQDRRKADATAPDGEREDGPPSERRSRDHRQPPPWRHTLQVAADLTPMQTALRGWLVNLLFMAIGGEVMVVAVVLLAVRRGLKPLRPLATDIASINDANLARRVGTENIPQEIQPVVRQINALLDRLEAAFIREQSFIANAAHELRTPLAGMRTQLEVSLRRERSAEQSRQAIRDILDGATSLQHMLDGLLVLSRLDAGQVQPAIEPVDVAQLLRECWQDVARRANERGVHANWQMDEPLMLETDRLLLERIVNNVLGNATEYADPAEPIQITARRKGPTLTLRVTNAAPDLADADIACMFDRFWRKDAARSEAGRHAGLGLSLVQQCVGALSGQTSADLTDGRLTITVTLQEAANSDTPVPQP